MRHLRWSLLIAVTSALPSCSVYNESLLEDAVGGDGDGDGTGGSEDDTGGTGSGAASGGGTPSSGSSTGSGGSDETGGMGGEMTGGSPGGGSDGGSGGTPNTGGTTGGTGGTPADCIDGAPAAFMDLGTTKELDSFDNDWPLLTSKVTAWNNEGYWSGAGDPGVVLAKSLKPKGNSLEWEAGKGYVGVCDTSGYALHIHATGSDAWGVSFAAQFNSAKTNVDLSAYDGVVFWARSDNKSLLKVAYATAAAPNVDIGTAPVPPLSASWVQKTMAFPTAAAFEPTTVALLKFIGVAPSGGDGTIDIWIDNVTFYTDPAE